MTATLLELGDAASRNLEFSHRDDVWVSYGEETITETNLLEIRRRHPERVYVCTFSKPVEAKKGADWEWHVVGEKLTAKMRVQAKRLQSNDVLRIKHKVASSGKQQRDLLMAEAHTDKMKPIYCIYCTEPQRTVWTQITPPLGYKSYHMGCLLADASGRAVDHQEARRNRRNMHTLALFVSNDQSSFIRHGNPSKRTTMTSSKLSASGTR